MTTTSKWMILPLVLALAGAPFAIGNANVDSPTATSEATHAPAPSVPVFPAASSDPATRVLAIAAAIDAWHLDLRGESPALLVRPDVSSPSEAVGLLAARHGASLPLADALVLEAMPAALSGPFTDVVVDFLVLEDEANRAFAPFDMAVVMQDPAAYADDLRLAGVIAAQHALLSSALGLKAALADTSLRAFATVSLPGVFFADMTGGCADDVYSIDAAFILDECGNDVYANNAGGAGAVPLICGTALPPDVAGDLVAAAVLDFNGDDSYVGDRGCGKNGGAFGGAGFLMDAAGHDLYEAANDGTNGGAVFGAGFLVDMEGSDLYPAGGWGTNGGGYPGGRGVLIELAGNDAYSGTYEAVNGGGLLGIGTLWDDAGDDSYLAEHSGVNGGGQGGTGLLYDNGGHDVYEDFMGGTGVDFTVVPKEISGAQIDNA